MWQCWHTFIHFNDSFLGCFSMSVCMGVCMWVCACEYVHVSVHVCIWVCVHVVCACECVLMWVCMHVCICMWIWVWGGIEFKHLQLPFSIYTSEGIIYSKDTTIGQVWTSPILVHSLSSFLYGTVARVVCMAIAAGAATYSYCMLILVPCAPIVLPHLSPHWTSLSSSEATIGQHWQRERWQLLSHHTALPTC